jgi:acetyl-CoA synthetase
VILNAEWEESQELIGELKNEVRHHIGPFASPDMVMVVPGLPKTRSGKIMRRILRSIAAKNYTDLGDTTTLADPTVVDALIAKRKTI